MRDQGNSSKGESLTESLKIIMTWLNCVLKKKTYLKLKLKISNSHLSFLFPSLFFIPTAFSSSQDGRCLSSQCREHSTSTFTVHHYSPSSNQHGVISTCPSYHHHAYSHWTWETKKTKRSCAPIVIQCKSHRYPFLSPLTFFFPSFYPASWN